MTRGYDESSRLMSDDSIPSSSAPNLTVVEAPEVEIRSSVYGSIDNTVNTVLSNSDTEPLLDLIDGNKSKDDPKV